jgi:diguanylate cyclase (GGDEF)-like protein
MPFASPNIRIVCQSPERAESLRALLAAEGLLSRADERAPPDVVVTDALAAAFAEIPVGLSRADVGFISVSGDNDADVVLPADAAARELALACRLLGQIVHLRREQRQHVVHEHELEQLAYLDPLTELANRRAWDNELSRRLARLRAGGSAFCLALVDVDHFKSINDAHGHLVGDAVLRALAQALRAHVRDRDVVARLGGDEFGLLLENVTPGFAAEVVDRIRAQALVTAGNQPEPSVGFTASAGFCCAEATFAATPQSLYAIADRGLGAAKASGRNRTASSDGLK